jgi:hypothetical protein
MRHERPRFTSNNLLDVVWLGTDVASLHEVPPSILLEHFVGANVKTQGSQAGIFQPKRPSLDPPLIAAIVCIGCSDVSNGLLDAALLRWAP